MDPHEGGNIASPVHFEIKIKSYEIPKKCVCVKKYKIYVYSICFRYVQPLPRIEFLDVCLTLG